MGVGDGSAEVDTIDWEDSRRDLSRGTSFYLELSRRCVLNHPAGAFVA